MTRIIQIDARGWQDEAPLYGALLALLDAPDDHEHSRDALRDSWIGGGINGVEPPFILEIESGSRPEPVLSSLFDFLVETADEARSVDRMIDVRIVYR